MGGGRRRLGPCPADAAAVVLACGPGDQHTVGLEALAALLRHEQQPCRVLGARASPRAIVTAVGAGPARAVVVVSHLRAHRLAATQALRTAAPLGPDLFYAGAAFGTVRLRRNVPGTFLGTNLQAACATIVATGIGSSPPIVGRQAQDGPHDPSCGSRTAGNTDRRRSAPAGRPDGDTAVLGTSLQHSATSCGSPESTGGTPRTSCTLCD